MSIATSISAGTSRYSHSCTEPGVFLNDFWHFFRVMSFRGRAVCCKKCLTPKVGRWTPLNATSKVIISSDNFFYTFLVRILELTEANETQTGRQQTAKETPSRVECTQHETQDIVPSSQVAATKLREKKRRAAVEDMVPSSQVAPTKLREKKRRAAVEDIVPSSQVAPTKLRENKRRAAVAPTKAVEKGDVRTHARDRQGSRRPLAFTPPLYWKGKPNKN